MRVDRTLIKEIEDANGDRSRNAKFMLLRRIETAREEMSTPDITTMFGDMLRKHGRAVVAICVAATLRMREERLDGWRIDWATEVLAHWKTKPVSGIDRAVIDDRLHPTRICEYAGKFIQHTTEY